ncbi:MAG: hypothetical protein SFV55_15105 [Haliscomenobacter sp.]|uniref:hypothetical protein n=1 Tax=Haliscomenobacter sp. TaxID=2717303 RepID=UPI0029A3ADFF|nr:hypothetical protein [Haliscomenobacter sp.]MDX2069755.1 hypothetical protein [Haliscomenobacter sp.]
MAKPIDYDALLKDFVDLPKDLENEFQQTQFSLAFPNEEKMIISEGTKDFALGLYEHIFGYNPTQALKGERQKAEEERQRINTTILNLHQSAKISAAEIANIVVIDLENVETLIAESQNSVHTS